MYADAEAKMAEILALVEKCPEPLQAKCFELLLSAYLASKVVSQDIKLPPPPNPGPGIGLTPRLSGDLSTPGNSTVPDQLRARFVATAGRVGVPVDRLAALFDFQLDPYTFHALNVPGANKAEKARNVGMLLCAKSYLTMTDWSADWKEFRGMCLDHDFLYSSNPNDWWNLS